MPLNNTNLKFNNQTSFVPSNYIEKMTTYEHLATAEKELRSALATVVDTASPTLLTRLIHLLDSINDIKRGFVSNDIDLLALTLVRNFSLCDKMRIFFWFQFLI